MKVEYRILMWNMHLSKESLPDEESARALWRSFGSRDYDKILKITTEEIDPQPPQIAQEPR